VKRPLYLAKSATTPTDPASEGQDCLRLYLGLPSDPEGEDPFAFRRVEAGTLVLVGLGEF
jgi:hypothetical protein